MNDETKNREHLQKAWLRKLTEEFLKLEPLFPGPTLFPGGNESPWLQNIERELSGVMYPFAKLKDDLNPTPRRVGGLLGRSCAYGVWTLESLEALFETPVVDADLSGITPEQIESGNQFISAITDVWYPALRRFAKRALCSAVDQDYESMREFLLAYSREFSLKPMGNGLAYFGNTTTEIYVVMLLCRKAVDTADSVRQLHDFLCKVCGSHRIGELKRVEKICERIGLRYRKPGRPKKAKIIPTPA